MAARLASAMDTKLFWLAYRLGDRYRLCPCQAQSRQAAIHYGIEHVLDRELVAVFSDDVGMTHAEMLRLAPLLPPPCSPMWTPEEWWPEDE